MQGPATLVNFFYFLTHVIITKHSNYIMDWDNVMKHICFILTELLRALFSDIMWLFSPFSIFSYLYSNLSTSGKFLFKSTLSALARPSNHGFWPSFKSWTYQIYHDRNNCLNIYIYYEKNIRALKILTIPLSSLFIPLF